jgi:hypothetical protein
MGRTACTEPQCLYSRATPLLPLWAVRPVQSLSAYITVHFTFYLLFLKPEQFVRYGEQGTGWTTEESLFDFRKEPTQPRMQCVPKALSRGKTAEGWHLRRSSIYCRRHMTVLDSFTLLHVYSFWFIELWTSAIGLKVRCFLNRKIGRFSVYHNVITANK